MSISDQAEHAAARMIIEAALERRYTVSVWDGGTWVVKYSRDVDQIAMALQSSDEDQLRLHDESGHSVGTMLLIWGNSPEELVADHSDNDAIKSLLEAVQP
jgi:hypothetical protein